MIFKFRNNHINSLNSTMTMFALSLLVVLVVFAQLAFTQLVTCPANTWMCNNSVQCINATFKCDNILHCSDGSDEGTICSMF